MCKIKGKNGNLAIHYTNLAIIFLVSGLLLGFFFIVGEFK
jgi:hypothetical protein